MTSAKALPNYVRSLGVVDGLRLFIRSVRTRSRRKGQYEAFRVRTYGTHVHLRATRSDHSILFQCLVKKQYDISAFPQFKDLFRLYLRQIEQGRTPLIIDCGGNIGLSAVWFATQFPKAKIVVVEPDAENLELLRLNVAPFGERVQVVAGAVWNRPAQLRIVNPQSGSAAFRVEETDGQARDGIRAYSIDELCEIGGNSLPMIVKIDVEGAQKALFSSNTDWVGRAGMIGLELDDWLMPWAGTSRPFFRCLSEYEYDFLLSGEAIYCFNAALLVNCNVQI
jgi:FkbM family methyltransferase